MNIPTPKMVAQMHDTRIAQEKAQQRARKAQEQAQGKNYDRFDVMSLVLHDVFKFKPHGGLFVVTGADDTDTGKLIKYRPTLTGREQTMHVAYTDAVRFVFIFKKER